MSAFVLGSASPGRREILRNAGLDFAIMRPKVDEEALRKDFFASERETGPAALAAALARAKAAEVSLRTPSAVLGADQILEMNGKIFTKAENLEGARASLLALRGQTHRLISAVAVAREGEILWEHVETAEMEMRDFSDAFLEDYLAAAGEDILSSVGCYRIEAEGVQLFKSIRGDWFTIIGLPLVPFLAWLRGAGLLAR